ncbi:MAG: mechanosensitive ion channel [Bacteroidota bacterium]
MEELQSYWSAFVDGAIRYLPTLATAIIVLVVGFWVIKKMISLAQTALEKASFSPEIRSFLLSILDIGLKVVVLLVAAGIVGINTASLVAVMAAAGFAVGLALQGSLGNFAAGIIILVFKPYRVGDWIEVQESFGKVEEIQIFSTIIGTPGQKTLIIPNGQVIEGVVTNFSTKGKIRLELNVTMPYEESFPKVKEIILKVLKDMPKVHDDPKPEVGIEQYDSHNIILTVRPFVDPDDYWDVTFEAYEKIKNAYNNNNIKVAYSEGVELGPIGN